MSANLRSKVISGYRQLLRTRLMVFKNDDRALRASRLKLREEFVKHKDVTDPTKLASLIKGIEEVEEMLRFNVVQAERNERGNFEVRIRPEQADHLAAEQDREGERPVLSHADESARAASGEVKVDQCCTAPPRRGSGASGGGGK